MTPENVLKASELIRELENHRFEYEQANKAREFTLSFGNAHLITEGGELFDELKNLAISTVTDSIARAEAELTKLGVDVPSLEFVNMG